MCHFSLGLSLYGNNEYFCDFEIFHIKKVLTPNFKFHKKKNSEILHNILFTLVINILIYLGKTIQI